jgi:hypothetical protein
MKGFRGQVTVLALSDKGIDQLMQGLAHFSRTTRRRSHRTPIIAAIAPSTEGNSG